MTRFFIACICMVTSYITIGAMQSSTLLRLLEEPDNLKQFRKAIKAGKNVNEITPSGTHILWELIDWHQKQMAIQTEINYISPYALLLGFQKHNNEPFFKKTVLLMIQKGLNLHYQDPNDKSTILHEASAKGIEWLVDLALEAGVSVNTQDTNNGYTPLHYALMGCWAFHTHQPQQMGAYKLYLPHTIHKLLKAGADLSICDYNCNTPLHRAVEIRHVETSKAIIPLLLFYGADPDAKNIHRLRPYDCIPQEEDYMDIKKMLKNRESVAATIKQCPAFKKEFKGNLFSALQQREYTGSLK